jgi:phage virion morphogenesis protein
MAGGLQGIDRVLKRVNRLANRMAGEIERPLKAAGVYMLGSIERNFKSQGRPDKWEKLKPATVARRRKGRGTGSPQILINTGSLKNSHSVRIRSQSVEVGTNKVQAKRLHFGYPGGEGRGRAKTPARPFVMFQDEDFDAIGKIFSRHVTR